MRGERIHIIQHVKSERRWVLWMVSSLRLLHQQQLQSVSATNGNGRILRSVLRNQKRKRRLPRRPMEQSISIRNPKSLQSHIRIQSHIRLTTDKGGTIRKGWCLLYCLLCFVKTNIFVRKRIHKSIPCKGIFNNSPQVSIDDEIYAI